MKFPKVLRRAGAALIALAFWVAVWHLLASWVDQDLLLVGPRAAGERFIELLGEADFYSAILTSMRNIFLGFALAVIAGFLLAVGSFFIPPMRIVIHPAVKVMRVVPVASVTILLLAFVTSVWLPMYAAALMVLPLTYINVYRGLEETDPQLIEMCHVYRMPVWHKIRYLYLPATAPYFIAACTTGFGYAWKAGVTAEVISSATSSIGRNLADAKVYFDMPSLFAWTITIVVLSLLTEQLLKVALRPLEERVRQVRGEIKHV